METMSTENTDSFDLNRKKKPKKRTNRQITAEPVHTSTDDDFTYEFVSSMIKLEFNILIISRIFSYLID